METMSLPITGSAAPLGLVGRSVCHCHRLNVLNVAGQRRAQYRYDTLVGASN